MGCYTDIQTSLYVLSCVIVIFRYFLLMPCGVYRILNLSNKKTYVGQASDIYQRWRQHRHQLRAGSHPNRHLQAAWNHYGEDCFDFAIVLECSPEKLGEQEIFILNTISSELRYNIGVAGYNPTLGLKKRYESKLQQSRSRGGRPFFQKNSQTGEVKRFEFASDVTDDKNVRDGINKCLSQGLKTHQGFAYYYDESFVPTPFVKPSKKVEHRNREIVGKNLETGNVLRFPYVAKVTEAGFQRTGVIKCLAGQMETHRGHTWRYADELPHKTMSSEQREKLSIGARKLGGSRAVVGTNIYTGEIVRFPYARAASKALDFHPSYIHLCLAGNMRQAGGFVWTYADGLPHRPRVRRARQ